MRYYMAPLEGITDSIYRRLHCKYFPGLDRYYTPFFSPTIHRSLTSREARELPAADSLNAEVVPQLLTKSSEDFIWMTGVCRDLGYREVNLNLGCPSGTVTAKGKGSGMLREPDSLARFLDEIFAGSLLPVSIKTRIGFTEPEEFPALLEIYNRYPVAELTVHPRVRKVFYEGKVDMDAFYYAAENSKSPLCYNGNLCTKSQIAHFSQQHPQIPAVMLGRGLVGDPGMFTPGGTTIEKLEPFLAELLEQYSVAFGGSRNAMFRMKEQWSMILGRFDCGEKLKKRLRKTTDLVEYRQIVKEIFQALTVENN